MIKTDTNGQLVGFSLSDLSNTSTTEPVNQQQFFSNGIKNAEKRMKDNFLAQTFQLRNLYINKLNTLACGMDVRPVPWNEFTDENDIQEILKKHPEYQIDYDLELYEEKMLSMGLDPTEGMFKQFPPGKPILSSGLGRHLAYMEECKMQEGLNIPELENFMMGVTKANDPELAQSVDNSISDRQLEESIYAQAQYDRHQMASAIGLPPVLPNGQFNFDALNLPFGHFVPLLPVPQRIYDLSKIQPPRDIEDEMKDMSIPYETRLKTYNDTVKYVEECNNYIKGAYLEPFKQQTYNEIRELMDQRVMILNSQYSAYLQNQFIPGWDRDVANIDKCIQELKERIPVYPIDDFYRYEQSVLEYNYQVNKYNTNKHKYECYKAREAIKANPYSYDFITHEELYANGCYMDLNTKEWFDRFGRPLNKEKAAHYDELNRIKAYTEQEAENIRRRNEYANTMFAFNEMIRDVVEHNGGSQEDATAIIERDPFGMMQNLNYNPYYQTSSTWKQFNDRINPRNECYDPETGKRVEDLTPEELDRFSKHVDLRAKNARASMCIPLTPEMVMRMNNRGINPDGTFQVWRMRSPLTFALSEANDRRKALENQGVEVTLFDSMNEVRPAYEYSLSHMRPKDLSSFYNHKDFNDTIENFIHKTRIGRTSDLLNELDDNAEFAKAMNNGILGLSLPEEIGYNYNKRRVDFDNSILEQMVAIKKPLPQGARIKDPETETYNDMPLSEIQKERYGLAMNRAAKLRSYFSPELGGTWDATAVNDK